MKTRTGLTVITASYIFTYLSGGVVAQTPQASPVGAVEAQRAIPAARASHDPRLLQFLRSKPASTVPRGAVPQAKVSGATSQHFTTFDAPGAVKGTYGYAINAEGVIAGYYIGVNDAVHGFLRFPYGGFSSFDAPGAVDGTYASAINDEGAVAGYYEDANGAVHGFLRSAEGGFSVFDAPGEGTGSYQGTFAQAINDFGVVTGYYTDGNLASHGFVRSPKGGLSTFDVPGAGSGGFFLGTYATAINLEGTVSGCYVDPGRVSHGFVRDWGGALTTFEAPSPLSGYCTSGFVGPNLGSVSALQERLPEPTLKPFLVNRMGAITVVIYGFPTEPT